MKNRLRFAYPAPVLKLCPSINLGFIHSI